MGERQPQRKFVFDSRGWKRLIHLFPQFAKWLIAQPRRWSPAPLIWAILSVKLTKGNCPHSGATISSDSSWGGSGMGPFQVLALCSPGPPSPSSSRLLLWPERPGHRLCNWRPHTWCEGGVQSSSQRESKPSSQVNREQDTWYP